ncbi:MAG: metal transporter permease [Solirubrobacterales bacterium]|jgi:ABC-2 type transport system permease protein|nr:metal transporter permease [Solirubrobacterales bacterium]
MSPGRIVRSTPSTAPLGPRVASAHPYLLVNQFTAWHDLFQTPTAGDAIVRCLWVSAAFALPPLLAAWAIFSRREVAS